MITVKYGKKLEAVFREPGGVRLRALIDECPNDLYSKLCFKGGGVWGEHLEQDFGADSNARALIDRHDDEELHGLMTNLAGHDLESLVEAFAHPKASRDRPCCFICYTIKCHGLPYAGHKDNHAGLMNPTQIASFRTEMGIMEGDEWKPFSGIEDRREQLRA